MERCPRCRTKYDPSYTVSCSNCGALLVAMNQPVSVPAGFEPADPGPALLDAVPLAPPPAKTPSLTRLARWALFVVLGVSGVIATFFVDATRDDTGSIVDQGVVDVTEARVGDCISFREEDVDVDIIFEFVGIPCADAHEMEVYALVNYEAEPANFDPGIFPGRETLEVFAAEECEARFEAYVGAPYDTEPLLDINYFTPEEDGWLQGDRGITCALVAVDESDLIGSMQGQGLVHYQSLTAGCYDLPPASDAVYGMHPRSCDGPHDVEVFSSQVEPSGPEALFDDDALIIFGDEVCQAEFDHYLESPSPDFTWSYFYPSAESWAEGDRIFTCFLQRIDEKPLIGTQGGGSA